MAHEFRKLEDDVLEKATRHDETVINEKRNDIKEHEAQISKDKSKLMKDLHEAEIKHDEKKIAREEKHAEHHEAKIKENEKVINDVK